MEELAGILETPEFLEDVKELNPARYQEYQEYMEYFSTYSLVIKCKELGLSLRAEDYDVDLINSMYEILLINDEKQRRKAKHGG